MADTDERRRTSFNEAPEAYARWRPGYPEALFDAIFDYGGLRVGDAALEVGCGPGQATLPMARRGLRLVAVEPGQRLAALVRQRSIGLDVTVEVARYEDWEPRGRTFRLVFAGSSFHWVDASVRSARAAEHLETAGAVAIFGNKHVRALEDDGFFDRVQELYGRHLPELTRRREPLPDANTVEAGYDEEMRSSLRFHDVEVRRLRWDLRFTADEYVGLLDTYSDHHVLPADTKAPLYEHVRRLIEDAYGGSVNRGYLTVLNLGRRT